MRLVLALLWLFVATPLRAELVAGDAPDPEAEELALLRAPLTGLEGFLPLPEADPPVCDAPGGGVTRGLFVAPVNRGADGMARVQPDSTVNDTQVLRNALVARGADAVNQRLPVGDPATHGGAAADGAPQDDRLRALQRPAGRWSRIVIASGARRPVPDGGGNGHSGFAHALLTALAGMDADACTAREVSDRFLLPMAVGQAAHEPQWRPIGRSGHGGGDVVLVRQGD